MAEGLARATPILGVSDLVTFYGTLPNNERQAHFVRWCRV